MGAGPGGSATAAYLAMAGLDVLLLEKTTFPREKVCGDGLTPRAVRELITLGIPHPEDDGWVRNKGLRIIGGGLTLALDWPETSEFPPYGLVRTRMDFDDILARHAVKHGARLLEATNVTGPVLDGSGRIVGVKARTVDENGRSAGPVLTYRAPLVVAADGNSSRLSLSMGRQKRDDRPMGVAVRTYYTSPRTNDDYLESWLELWVDDPKNPGERVLLPGYGWVFGVGDGTSNLGLGHPQHLQGVRQRRLQGRHAPVGRDDAGGVDLQRRDDGRPDPRCRPPDGLQPPAALRRRAAARR